MSLALPPNPHVPRPGAWPGWTGVRSTFRPGPALAALIEQPARGWPYWTGARPGPDHTMHADHGDREGGKP